jgi:16S rRNA (guanine966-N2)-methyltransferase
MRVLDLYAGTGALGIEALSREASWADFVEVHAGRCKGIRDALRELGLDRQSHVYRARVEKALDLAGGGYGLVLIDPPYDLDPWDFLMDRLNSSVLVNDNALVVAEHRHKRQLAERYGRMVQITTRRYGDTAISIYQTGTPDA